MGRRRHTGGYYHRTEELPPDLEEFLRRHLWDDNNNGGRGWWQALVQLCMEVVALAVRLLRAALALDTGATGGGAGSRADDARFGQGAPPPPASEEAPPGGETGSGAAAAFAKLGLDAATADAAAVGSAFRKLSLKCHPDKCVDDPTAPERFAALSKVRDDALAFLCRGEADAASTPRRDDGDSDSDSDSAGGRRNAERQRQRSKRSNAERKRRQQQKRDEAERAHARARAMHDAMQRAEAERLQKAAKEAQRAAKEALRAAELAAMPPEARARRVRAQWDERLQEHIAAQRAAERAEIMGSGTAARIQRAELDKPAAKARRRAAAEAALGPPPSVAAAAAAGAALLSPAGAYASSGVLIAALMRARAELHAFQYLQLCAFSGTLMAALAADCGAGTSALHHAAHAGWPAGIDLVLRFAGAQYAELALKADADGQLPLDIACERARDAAAAHDGVSPEERQRVLERLQTVTTAARVAQATAEAARAEAKKAKRDAAVAMVAKVPLGFATMPLRLLRLLLRALGLLNKKSPGSALG